MGVPRVGKSIELSGEGQTGTTVIVDPVAPVGQTFNFDGAFWWSNEVMLHQ
jgi:hypothetical protein